MAGASWRKEEFVYSTPHSVRGARRRIFVFRWQIDKFSAMDNLCAINSYRNGLRCHMRAIPEVRARFPKCELAAVRCTLEAVTTEGKQEK